MTKWLSAKWLSTIGQCDNCGVDLESISKFYDANIKGHWGLFCPNCFMILNGKLGTGLGQEYDTDSRDKLRG